MSNNKQSRVEVIELTQTEQIGQWAQSIVVAAYKMDDTIKRQQEEIERLKKLCYCVATSVPISSLGDNYIKLIKASKESKQ